MDPMKYLYEAPSLVGRLAKWLVLLIEFNVQYLAKKSIKGRDNPILLEGYSSLNFS